MLANAWIIVEETPRNWVQHAPPEREELVTEEKERDLV